MVNTNIKREGLSYWASEYQHATETQAYGVRRDSGWLPVSKLVPGQVARVNQVAPMGDSRFYAQKEPMAFITCDSPVLPGDVVPAEAFISTMHFLSTMTDTTADADRVNAVLAHAADWGGNRKSFFEAVDALVGRLNACGMTVQVLDGNNTHNQDNNFTSDFEYAVIRDNGWREDFIVLDRATPQFFRLADESEFYSFVVTFYCEALGAEWDNIWSFEDEDQKHETRYVIAEDGVTVTPQARIKGENDVWNDVVYHNPAAGF